MKRIKLFSLTLTMLINYVSFSQEKTLSIKISDSIINYKIDADFNILKLKEDKTLNISDDALFVVDDLISSEDNVKNLNIEEVKEINIFKGSQGGASFCHGNGKNNIIIIYKVGFKKESPKPEKNPVVIHCLPSIKKSEKPLWIIDGFISTENVLKDLNPNNIESINVIKAPSATAIYGSKAVNGVILITTKNLPKKELRKLKKNSERDYEKQENEKFIIPLQNR